MPGAWSVDEAAMDEGGTMSGYDCDLSKPKNQAREVAKAIHDCDLTNDLKRRAIASAVAGPQVQKLPNERTTALIRFDCKFHRFDGLPCGYHVTATPGLESWADQVMLRHVEQKHPAYFKAVTEARREAKEKRCGKCKAPTFEGACYCSNCGAIV